MSMGSTHLLRLTVHALMRECEETQADLARSLRLTQGQVSRKQTGGAAWTLPDVDRLSEHYGIAVPDLLSGPTHALEQLPKWRRLAELRTSGDRVMST